MGDRIINIIIVYIIALWKMVQIENIINIPRAVILQEDFIVYDQVTKLRLSCYLVLLSVDSKTR